MADAKTVKRYIQPGKSIMMDGGQVRGGVELDESALPIVKDGIEVWTQVEILESEIPRLEKAEILEDADFSPPRAKAPKKPPAEEPALQKTEAHPSHKR